MFCYKGLGPSYPLLKIALGGNFEMGSRSYLFQRIKLPRCTKFHVGIPKCTIVPLRALTIYLLKELMKQKILLMEMIGTVE